MSKTRQLYSVYSRFSRNQCLAIDYPVYGMGTVLGRSKSGKHGGQKPNLVRDVALVLKLEAWKVLETQDPGDGLVFLHGGQMLQISVDSQQSSFLVHVAPWQQRISYNSACQEA